MTDLTEKEQTFLLGMIPGIDCPAWRNLSTFASLCEKGLASRKESHLVGHRTLYTLTEAGEQARDTLLAQNARTDDLGDKKEEI